MLSPACALVEYADANHKGYSGILLFGSHANGDVKNSSDLDAIIFFDNPIRPFRQVVAWGGYIVDAWIYDIETMNGLVCTSRRSKNHVWLEIVISSLPLPHTTPQIDYLKAAAKLIQTSGPLVNDVRDIRHRLTGLVDDLKDAAFDAVEMPALAFSIFSEIQSAILFLAGRGGWKNKHAVRFMKDYDPPFYEKMNAGLRGALAGDSIILLDCAAQLLFKLGGELRDNYFLHLQETVRVPLIPLSDRIET